MKDILSTTPLSETDLVHMQRGKTAEGVALVAQHASGEIRAALKPHQPLVIGREPPANIVIPDGGLSRQHARIEVTEGLVWLEDLGSTNGTWVNGERIDRTWVTRADTIALAGVPVEIRGAATTAAAQGLRSHDQFLALLEYEVLRGRAFDRPLAVLMLGEVAANEMGRFVGSLRRVLRPVDQAALYGPSLLELLLPEADQRLALETAQRLVVLTGAAGHRCGVAVCPDLAASAGELITVSLGAYRSADGEQPVLLAPDRRTGSLPVVSKQDEPVVASAAMRDVYETVERVAPANLPVLICGETGTGKELVAQAIHEGSRRAGGPFRCLNCGAIPDQLVESALFGHEKGAFTGAGQLHRGLFESADGGTVFLDEIGELAPAAQVALLRVLETQRLTRVGGSKEIAVDVRIIAATHRELERMCEEGTFRLDLLYRLNSMVLELPPLRERPEDLEALAARFLEQACRDNARQLEGVDPAALDALRRHRWPGNVRELRNAIERAVVITRGPTLTLDDLPAPVRALGQQATNATQAPPTSAGSAAAQPSDDGLEFKERVQRFEAALIEQTLRECNGNQSETSRRLRIPLRTLISKIQSYGLAKRP